MNSPHLNLQIGTIGIMYYILINTHLKEFLSAIYYEGKLKNYYVKRFNVETNTMNKKFMFISQEKGSKLEYCTYKLGETISFKYFSDKKLKPTEIDLDSFIDVKGWKIYRK